MNAVMWVSLKSIVLRERNLTQKKDKLYKSIYKNSKQAKLIYNGKRSEQRLPLGVWEQGMTGKNHEGIFQGDGDVLYLDRSLGYTFIKTH